MGSGVVDAGVGGCETELVLTLHYVTHRKHMFSSIRPFADEKACSCRGCLELRR